MAKKAYVGVNNVARNVSKMYVGVNGVARRVKKAYVGVNGVAKQCYPNVKIVTWNGGTDAEIVAMVQAADKGLINLSDYWSIGDERTVSLSSIPAEYGLESHSAQNVVLKLLNVGGKTLNTATESGRTTCSFIVGMKNCLNEYGFMHTTASTSGGWAQCARRNWCNNSFKNSMPQTLIPIFKKFKNSTGIGNSQTSLIQTDDWFALPSEIEVQGTNTYSAPREGTQFTLYETKANRIKQTSSKGGNWYWWNRSPNITTDATYYVMTSLDGGADSGAQANNFPSGISPFGVI